ncbi:hypothetical protein GCM10027258_82230 [Amycolatopsis stemonae]
MTAGALDVAGAGVVTPVVGVVRGGAGAADGGVEGPSDEHEASSRVSTAPNVAVALRRIRPAWQKRSVSAESTRSSDTVLGPLGLGY